MGYKDRLTYWHVIIYDTGYRLVGLIGGFSLPEQTASRLKRVKLQISQNEYTSACHNAPK